jgi:hypothetical protein
VDTDPSGEQPTGANIKVRVYVCLCVCLGGGGRGVGEGEEGEGRGGGMRHGEGVANQRGVGRVAPCGWSSPSWWIQTPAGNSPLAPASRCAVWEGRGRGGGGIGGQAGAHRGNACTLKHAPMHSCFHASVHPCFHAFMRSPRFPSYSPTHPPHCAHMSYHAWLTHNCPCRCCCCCCCCRGVCPRW